jgi:hypothetical protein
MGGLDVLSDGGRLLHRRWSGLVDRAKAGVFVDPGPSCPISWKPSVFAPVFYGYRDTTAVIPPVVQPGAAAGEAATAGSLVGPAGDHAFGHPVRIWFPSLDGSPQHAEILEGCGRYPLVILAHGSCPEDEDHYQKWFELPAVLARSGYVVVVPELDLEAPSGNEGEQQLVGDLARWARSEWEHSDVVMPAPATALVGHSWGAGLLGHVAAEAPGSYAAYVSLSGVEVPGEMHRTTMPTLFTWGGDLSLEVLGVQLSQWEQLASPAHVAEFLDAGHWDYLPAGRSACDELNGRPQRGSCTLTPFVAADLVACFLTRYLRPEGVPVVSWGPLQFFVVPRSLRPPAFYPHYLTTEQEFYAGGHLRAWGAVPSQEGCAVALRWILDGDVGELVHD